MACVCWGEEFIAFEGLWTFGVDMSHPEIKLKASDNESQVMIEQRVRFVITKALHSGGREFSWFEAWEYLPVQPSGITKPDPHWDQYPYGLYCGAIAYEVILARAFWIQKPKGSSPEDYQRTYVSNGTMNKASGPQQPDSTTRLDREVEGADGKPADGFSVERFASETPWSTQASMYTPVHCTLGYPNYSIGTNPGPKPVPLPRTPTPPDSHRGGIVIVDKPTPPPPEKPPRGFVTDPDHGGPHY